MNPDEVESRQFLVSLRGYARDEVDSFKSEVVQNVRRLNRALEETAGELAALQDRYERAQAELASVTGQLAQARASLKAEPVAQGTPAPDAEQTMAEEKSAAYRLVGQETERILMAAEQVAQEMHERAMAEAAGIMADARMAADRTFAEIGQAQRKAEEELDKIREDRAMIASQTEDIGRRLAETVARLRVPVQSPGTRSGRTRPGAADAQAARDRPAPEMSSLRERQAAELLKRRQAVDPQALRDKHLIERQEAEGKAALERHLAQRQAAQRQAAQREEAERQAAERQAAEKLEAAQREEAQREEAEEREAEKRQAAERQAAERQAAERQAAEREAAQRQAAERQPAERQAAEKRRAAEEREAEKRQAAERQAAEKLEAEEREAEKRQAAEEREAAEREAATVSPPAENGLHPARTQSQAGASSLNELLQEIRGSREAQDIVVPAASPEQLNGPGESEEPAASSDTTSYQSPSMLDLRAEALGDLPVQAFRRLKRLLQQDHNDLLDRLRTQRGKGSLEDNLAPLPEQFGRFQEGLSEALSTSFAHGQKAGGGPGPADPAKVVSNLVARQVVNPLRSEVSRAIQAGLEACETASAISERASDVFRVWKGVRTELLGQGMVYAAFNQGLVDAWSSRPNIAKSWQASDVEDECPNDVCAKNAAGGPIALKAAFASGHLTPPAHGGCTCTLTGTSV